MSGHIVADVLNQHTTPSAPQVRPVVHRPGLLPLTRADGSQRFDAESIGPRRQLPALIVG
jgi:hypothetical protein